MELRTRRRDRFYGEDCAADVLLARELEVAAGCVLDHGAEGEEGDYAADDRIDPAAHHEALGEDAADGQGEGKAEDRRCPGRTRLVNDLAGLGDVPMMLRHDAM